jgi:hypothetical protein
MVHHFLYADGFTNRKRSVHLSMLRVMADLSTLCEACHRMFKSQSRDMLLSPGIQQYRPYHFKVRELLRAVESKCFLCSAVWEHASAQFKAGYACGWEFAMTYRLYLSQDEPEGFNLVIRHSNERIPNDHCMIFRLVHVKGMSNFLRSVSMYKY